jgi:glycosyltransferase involved in cell wall biosynthesis
VRIALDMRRVSEFGVATYVRNIVRALARCDSQNQYRLIGPPSRLREFGELPPNFLPIPYALNETSPRDFFHFQNVVRRHDCHLVHVPHLFWIPQRASCPYVVTVHDLLGYLYPQPGRRAWKNWAETYLTRRVLTHAARIVAVSNSTKSDLVQLFRISEEKIEVVYNAIDERFRRGHASPEDRQLIAERYQVNYPFLLYAGNIKAHKNIGRIIEAFAALKAELAKENVFDDLKLIIIGDELSKHPDLRRTVIKAGVQNDVRFLGFVPIDVLRIFYDLAKIFVFPSLYEGFGLPPLEAMALGTPVVTSNASSLPEVVGNAAVLVNPENVFEIMRALHRVLVDQALRDRLKERSYQQAQRFSWETAAERILQIYRQAASPGRSLSSAAD